MNKAAAKRWMRANVEDHVDRMTGEVNATTLAEAWACEVGADEVGGMLDDETHWVWDAAVEVAVNHERSHR